MDKEEFFKPTLLYKEYMILDLIEKDSHITQRKISAKMDTAVSLVNEYLQNYEKKGYLLRNYISSKTVEYKITKEGIERKKVLNIGFLKSSQNIYNYAKENISRFLEQIANKGFKKILLYGAGEVAEILLSSIQSDEEHKLSVLAIIDDDLAKQNSFMAKSMIIGREQIKYYKSDAVLVSSYSNRKIMYKNLIESGYAKDKILGFFDKE